MEQNQNTLYTNNNIQQRDDASAFNSKQYKEDLQNLKALFDQQQLASAPDVNDTDAIASIQVPVVVPVQVEVPVQVPIPVQVPVQEQEPSQQPESKFSPKLDNNGNARNNNEELSNFNVIKKNIDDDFQQSLDTIKCAVEKTKDAVNNVIETSKDCLGLNNNEIKLEKLQIVDETSQALEKEDQPIINNAPKSNLNAPNEENNNFDSDEFNNNDNKKEHKDINDSNNDDNSFTFNNVMNQANNALKSGIKTIKDNLGLNESLSSKEKEPLLSEPLNEEKRNLEKNELQDIKQEHKLNNESTMRNMINQGKEAINNGVEKVEDMIGLNKEQERRLTFSKAISNVEQEKQLLEHESKTRLNEEVNKDIRDTKLNDNKKINQQEVRPLMIEDNTLHTDDQTIRTGTVRSYADVVTGTTIDSGNIDDRNNMMVAGDTSAFKDIKSNAFNSNTTDLNTFSQPRLEERDNEKELQATKDTIPSQNDIAPQVNDASA